MSNSVFTNDLQVADVDQERQQLPRDTGWALHIRDQLRALKGTAHYAYAVDTILLTNGRQIVAGCLVDTIDNTSLDFEIVNQWWVKILTGWTPLPEDADR